MQKEIEIMLKEDRMYYPPKNLSRNAHIKSFKEYERLYKESINNPEKFWARHASENLEWFKKWDKVMEYDFSRIGEIKAPYVKFFSGGKLNVSYNCLDRHIKTARRNKAAIIWQGEKEEGKRVLTYEQLHSEVSRFSNVLKNNGIKKGNVVTIYLPMIPELTIAMLACSRIGAIHSVVFSAFSANALGDRIIDCKSKMVITCDVSFYNGKTFSLKQKADEAVNGITTVKRMIVYKRGRAELPLSRDERGGNVKMESGRDFWWHEEMEKAASDFNPVEMDAEDPLFILYTSGSTGKPKGVLHTTGGYLLYATLTAKYIFDLKDEDIFWCTADIGWITGHSYVVYGPLSNGATVFMYEGASTYPAPDRFWKIIEDNKVNIFYTAPTAIRTLMSLGDQWPKKHNLLSLRILGTVGEPINPEAWMWYFRVIGNENCPIVDTWWQTETGGIMITPLPGAIPTKPGSASKPFFGISPQILREDGAEADVDEGGKLVITRPWPGMIRGVYGDKMNKLVKKVYFSAYPGKYFTGDGAGRDKKGFYWLLGRIDDVINVSGHRFSTAEIESAFVSHKHVAEAAVVGYHHDIKGQGIHCFITLKHGVGASDSLKKILINHVRSEISPIAAPDKIQFAESLPKTRSGKIMRRILRKIAEGELETIGDTTTLADPSVVEKLISERV